MAARQSVELTGDILALATIEAVATGKAEVTLVPSALEHLAAGREVVEAALAKEEPVYGLTTGLGARVTHRLSNEDLAAFSLRTVQGRAQSVGPELDRETVRAALLIHLNGRLAGGSGLSPAIGQLLADMLNADLRPALPAIGSLGAGDLCILGHLGAFVAGEGRGWLGAERGEAKALFAKAGLAPAQLGPKDGLALINSSSAGAALAALTLARLQRLHATAQVAGALSLEAFRGNLSPLHPQASAARAQPGQTRAAKELLALLEGSLLQQPGQARRVQDPISLRCLAPIHGSQIVAWEAAFAALEPETGGGSSDNPLILPDRGQIISTGNFLTPHLTLTLETLARALAHSAAACLARMSRLMVERFSGLPNNLTTLGSGHSGFAPLMKVGESLLGEITHLAQPAPLALRWGADGVEDDATHTPLAAKNLSALADRLVLLLSLELVVAAQALELAAPAQVAPRMEQALALVRSHVAPLGEDRSFSAEVMALAAGAVSDGRLSGLLDLSPAQQTPQATTSS
ncbi:MAG: aromatic amino acid lyase [Pseudomonadota bacterium]